MIPPTIHYCWFGGGGQSRRLRRCRASWQKVLPDYQVKEWNETNSPLDNRYTRAAYDKKLWSRLSNYVRLHAVYTEGGIYLDTDIEVIRSLTPLRHDKCFVGFQQAEAHDDWINSAVLGAQPGHHFLQRCMDLTVKLFATEGEFYRGPAIATAVLKEMGLSAYGLQEVGEVTVYPAEYFYPYPWFGKYSPDCITENTYCIHHWAGSWLQPTARRLPSPSRIVGRMLRTFTRKPCA